MISELKLLKGEPFCITDSIIDVKHPTLQEIYDYSEGAYTQIVSLFCAKPYDYMVELDETGYDFQKIDNYEFFTMRFSYDIYSEGIKWLLGINFPLYKYETDDTLEIVIGDEFGNIIINKSTFLLIRMFLMKINGLSEKNEFNLASDASPLAKKMIMDEKRRERNKAKKKQTPNESFLANSISALAWNNEVGINMINIWNLPIYVLTDGINRKRQSDSYRYTMQGLYAGTIDSKNLDFESIDWASKIKNN